MNANFKGNADAVIAAMREAVENALEECGLQAEKYAKKLAPVDTGRLRNSFAARALQFCVGAGVCIFYENGV